MTMDNSTLIYFLQTVELGQSTTQGTDISTANFTGTSVKSDSCGNSVHDKDYNQRLRIIMLYATISFGTVGGFLVLGWMWHKRRLKSRLSSLSRVNTLILNLTIADLMVMAFAVIPQLIWEYQDNREWLAGAFMCKAVKFMQSFTLMASTYMVVIIAIDRHEAITRPLRTPCAVWKLAGAAWGMAVAGSLPMLYVFRINVLNDESSSVTKCESIFRDRPISHRKAFLTYAAVIVFLIPILLLMFCYIRIFLTIARKANEGSRRAKNKQLLKPGKIHLERNTTDTLPKARKKTLKMTFVIVVVFLMCSIPYFIAEMIMSYGNHCLISKLVYGILGGLAAANSAANPFVFILFNVKVCKSKDSPRQSSDGAGYGTHKTYSTGSRGDYVSDSKNIYQVTVKYKWNPQTSGKNSVEMTSIR